MFIGVKLFSKTTTLDGHPSATVGTTVAAVKQQHKMLDSKAPRAAIEMLLCFVITVVTVVHS
jgi:hypothetical protein